MKQENPETLQSALDIIARDKTEKAVFLGLHVIENFVHYTNTFYFFDCNFNGVEASNVEKYVVFTEKVCYDAANRMFYSGVPEEKVTILDSFDMDVVLAELENIKTDNIYILTNWYSRDIIKNFIEEFEK